VNRAAISIVAVALAACQPSGTSPSTRPTPSKQLSVLDLVGDWRWLHRTEELGTTRIEEETWRLARDPASPMRLAGRYLRTVDVRSDDIVPFTCNQRRRYRQRALFDVLVDLDGNDLVVRETAYDTEDSPCDHGFRTLAQYTAEQRGNRLVLHWPGDGASDKGGEQTLWQVDDVTEPLPDARELWTKSAQPTGAWRWQAFSYDDDGNLRTESEWWEISRRTDTELDATYRRRVTVTSSDGKPIACAGAPSWSFDDAYLLRAQREEEHWHFYELAADAGTHPCLRPTPRRTTDEATAEQLGSYLVLEWRGKRRQVLYRPDAE
jgi:hypothetical protein